MQNRTNSATKPEKFVLDSFAVIAYLEAEAGGDRVRELLENAENDKCQLFISVINFGEVLYIVEREMGLPKAQETLARINELPIDVVCVDRSLTLAAAHIKAGYAISYADCFAAALAQMERATLVTGDPEFKKLKSEHQARIEWLKLKEQKKTE